MKLLVIGLVKKCKENIIWYWFIYCTECPSGKYGPACLYNCNEHCLTNKDCNVTTGRCNVGCKPGYTGEMCDTGIWNKIFVYSKQCS